MSKCKWVTLPVDHGWQSTSLNWLCKQRIGQNSLIAVISTMTQVSLPGLPETTLKQMAVNCPHCGAFVSLSFDCITQSGSDNNFVSFFDWFFTVWDCLGTPPQWNIQCTLCEKKLGTMDVYLEGPKLSCIELVCYGIQQITAWHIDRLVIPNWRVSVNRLPRGDWKVLRAHLRQVM